MGYSLQLTFQVENRSYHGQVIVGRIPVTKLEADGIIDLLIEVWCQENKVTIPTRVENVHLQFDEQTKWKWTELSLK